MSEDSAVDSAIDLKKRARRRLVGAAALALLAVIVLPIVMDSEPKPSGQEIQIRIPSQDSNSLAAKLIPGRPSLTPAQPVLETGKPAPTAEATPLKPAEVTEKPAQPGAAAPASTDKPKAEDKATAPVAKTDDAKRTDAAKSADAAHAEAVLEGKDSGQWIVQLGAYQSVGNVKQLTGKLKDLSIPSYTEKFDSPQGARIRVRAGPFKSHEAAEKARLRIKKIGVDGPVVQK